MIRRIVRLLIVFGLLAAVLAWREKMLLENHRQYGAGQPHVD